MIKYSLNIIFLTTKEFLNFFLSDVTVRVGKRRLVVASLTVSFCQGTFHSFRPALVVRRHSHGIPCMETEGVVEVELRDAGNIDENVKH